MPHECTSCRRVFPDGSKEMLSGCPDCGGNKFQFRPASGQDGSGGDGAADAAGDGAAATDAGSHGTAETSASTGRTADAGAAGATDESAEPPEPPGSSAGGVTETVAGATERVRDLVSGGDSSWPAVGREGGDEPAGADPSEDTAQASARSSVVERDELPDPPEHPVASESTAATSSDPAPATDPDASVDGPDADRTADVGPDATRAAADPDANAGEAGATAGDEPGSAPFTGSGDREETPDLAELRAELNDQFESIKIVDRGQYELNLMELYDREEYIVSLLEDGRYAIEVPETWRDE